jgi:hypothetical protein
MEFYNQEIELKVVFDTQNNTVTQRSVLTGDEVTNDLYTQDLEDLVTFMQVPGFGWGTALVKLGIYIKKKISGGSSAE